MFGYLKIQEDKKSLYYNQFKKNYCYLCKCLEKRYGFLSRFLLSFDITFFLMVVTDENYLGEISKIKCLTKLPNDYYETEIADKIACLNILLAAAKIEDDILDEKSILRKIEKVILSKTIKKSQKKYSKMWNIIDEGYKEIRKLEKEQADIKALESVFSSIICKVAEEEFNCNDKNRLAILEFTTKWIYFIDAYDDYDEDIKKDNFNPLKFKSTNDRYHFFNIHMKELYDIIKDVKMVKDKNYETAGVIMTESVRITNYKILKNKRISS